MGIFQQFPYTNFHEMNLDQLIKIMRQMQDEWAETKNEWASTKEFIDNFFANLDLQDEVDNRINEMLADGSFQAIVESFLDPFIEDFTTHINRSVLIIGDSYNTGTGGGQQIDTMAPHIAKQMNIPAARIFNYSEGGAGFVRNDEDSDPSFERNLDNAILNIAEPEKISDICVIGGANDATANAGVLQTNMNRFVTKARNNFPNAKLWLFAVGWSSAWTTRRNLMNPYRYYAENGNFTYVKLYHILQNKSNMGQVNHPNQNGVVALGRAIGSCLMGGNFGIENTPPFTEYIYFSDSGVQTPVTSWCDTDNVYVQFSTAPSEATTPKTIAYQPSNIGMGYITYCYGMESSEDNTYADHALECLAAKPDNTFKDFIMKLRFRKRGDGITDPVLDIDARTFNTESGALTSVPVKKLYLSPDVITIPIWCA